MMMMVMMMMAAYTTTDLTTYLACPIINSFSPHIGRVRQVLFIITSVYRLGTWA